MPLTRNQIIGLAESIIRKKGYHGFNLDDLAEYLQTGSEPESRIFKNKDELTRAVAVRYTYNFLVALGDPSPGDRSTGEQLRRYCGAFEQAFDQGGQACLCAVLSTEAATLHKDTRAALEDFVSANINWLTDALRSGRPGAKEEDLRSSAQWIYCSLQGALTASVLTQDRSWLNSAVNAVLEPHKTSETG